MDTALKESEGTHNDFTRRPFKRIQNYYYNYFEKVHLKSPFIQLLIQSSMFGVIKIFTVKKFPKNTSG